MNPLLPSGPFALLDWTKIDPVEHPGANGMARWRTVEDGGIRIRIVEYSPGYLADHWCERGHVVHVLEGELVTELKDGREFVLRRGESYRVGEKEAPHRSRSIQGAKLFIVD